MLKKLMQELDKGAQKLKESAMSADPKAKAEELARAAGGGVAQAAEFLKARAEAVKPKAEALGQAAREGFGRKAESAPEPDFGDAGEFEIGAKPLRAQGEGEAVGVDGKASAAARVAGEGVGAAFKFVKDRLEAARPGLERAAGAIAQSADDLARAAREGYEQRAREAELRELARQEREELIRRKSEAELATPASEFGEIGAKAPAPAFATPAERAQAAEPMIESEILDADSTVSELGKGPSSIDRKDGSL